MIGSTFFNSLGWLLTWDMGTTFGILLSSKWVYLGSSNLGSSYRCCQVLRHRMKMWSLAGAPGVGMHGLIFFLEWVRCTLPYDYDPSSSGLDLTTNRYWRWYRIFALMNRWNKRPARGGSSPRATQGPKFKIPLPESFVPQPIEYICQVSSTLAQPSGLGTLKVYSNELFLF